MKSCQPIGGSSYSPKLVEGDFTSELPKPNVLVFLAAAGLVGMFTLFPTAAEFGKRSREATPGSDEPTVSTPTSGPDDPAVTGQP
jgi:hypothetical protein